MKSGLLKIKVKVQGSKALVEDKLETNRKGREELISEVEKVGQSEKKGKGKQLKFKTLRGV